MNKPEAANLLAVMQTYDQRTVGETDVIAWHSALGDLTFPECRDAVIAHYRQQTDRIMPAQVRTHVGTMRRTLAGEERQNELHARIASHSDRKVPMPAWFREVYEQARAETRASGKYPKDPVTGRYGDGPLAKTIDKLARDGAA